MDESKLIEKLRRIEALHAGATTAGERMAAAEARQRILFRLEELRDSDPPVEFQFSLTDPWSRKLFLALLRRYDLKPYRHYGQRRTTVMVKVPKRFLDETLWPEFKEISKVLHRFLEETTDRIIVAAVNGDSSDAAEMPAPRQLESGGS